MIDGKPSELKCGDAVIFVIVANGWGRSTGMSSACRRLRRDGMAANIIQPPAHRGHFSSPARNYAA